MFHVKEHVRASERKKKTASKKDLKTIHFSDLEEFKRKYYFIEYSITFLLRDLQVFVSLGRSITFNQVKPIRIPILRAQLILL